MFPPIPPYCPAPPVIRHVPPPPASPSCPPINVNTVGAQGWTPLYLAAMLADIASVNMVGAQGWTPLYLAAMLADIASVKALLAAGADARLVIRHAAHSRWMYPGSTLCAASDIYEACAQLRIKDSSSCIRALLAATQPEGSLAARCLAAPERLMCRSMALRSTCTSAVHILVHLIVQSKTY